MDRKWELVCGKQSTSKAHYLPDKLLSIAVVNHKTHYLHERSLTHRVRVYVKSLTRGHLRSIRSAKPSNMYAHINVHLNSHSRARTCYLTTKTKVYTDMCKRECLTYSAHHAILATVTYVAITNLNSEAKVQIANTKRLAKFYHCAVDISCFFTHVFVVGSHHRCNSVYICSWI